MTNEGQCQDALLQPCIGDGQIKQDAIGINRLCKGRIHSDLGFVPWLAVAPTTCRAGQGQVRSKCYPPLNHADQTSIWYDMVRVTSAKWHSGVRCLWRFTPVLQFFEGFKFGFQGPLTGGAFAGGEESRAGL